MSSRNCPSMSGRSRASTRQPKSPSGLAFLALANGLAKWRDCRTTERNLVSDVRAAAPYAKASSKLGNARYLLSSSRSLSSRWLSGGWARWWRRHQA